MNPFRTMVCTLMVVEREIWGPSPVLLDAMGLVNGTLGIETGVVDKVAAAGLGPQELVAMRNASTDTIGYRFACRGVTLEGTKATAVRAAAETIGRRRDAISSDVYYRQLTPETTWLLALAGYTPDDMDLFHTVHESSDSLGAWFRQAHLDHTLPQQDLRVLMYRAEAYFY